MATATISKDQEARHQEFERWCELSGHYYDFTLNTRGNYRWADAQGAYEAYFAKEQTVLDDYKFYKEFYEQNVVALMQYESLRRNFTELTNITLGKDYYNAVMDVYVCDELTCKDIAKKANKKPLYKKLLGTLFLPIE